MHHVQILAYPLLDRLQVSAVERSTSDHGYAWMHLVLEQIEIPPVIDPDEPWDTVWLVAHRLLELAELRRSERPL